MTRCAECGFPILGHEAPVDTAEGPKHEHCASAEDAMADGSWDPAEDYPHGDL